MFLQAFGLQNCYILNYTTLKDEKPSNEKTLIDVLIKDLMSSNFWFLFFIFMVQFISLFSPNVPMLNSPYLINHSLLFISNFHAISIFVFLYIQHVYIFQPDDFVGVDIAIIRRKSMMWKFLLTILMISLSCIFPILDPMMFSLISKGKQYDR